GAAAEPAALAVDHPRLDEAGRVPARELGVAQVGDVAAQPLLRASFVEAEVEQDAAHAFALEFERGALVGTERGVREGGGDRGLGTLEVTGVDQVDDRLR